MAAVSIVGVAIAAGGGSGGGLNVCAKQGSGALSLAKGGRCAKGERNLRIGQQGATGARGPTGDQGPRGPIGEPGPIGATGPEGAAGREGPAGEPGAPGADGEPAEVEPEPVQPVTSVAAMDPDDRPDCETVSGVFCSREDTYWTNFGSGYAPVGYQLDAGGYVHLQGMAEQHLGLGLERKEVFFLPPAYRPEFSRRFATVKCGGGPAYVDVQPSGAIEVEFAVPYCVSLDGIEFYP